MDSILENVPLTEIYLHNYLQNFGGVILYYDMLLTFGEEVQYAWLAPKRKGAWLFLLNRYFTPITDIVVFVANFTSFGSAESCQHYPIPHEIIIVVAVIIVGVISLLRTYALYNCNNRLLTFMVLVAAALIGFVCWSITGQHHVGVVLLNGCHEVISQITGTHNAAAWEALFAFDSMIFILTLVKTFKERDKRLAGASKLVELIFRDGAIYFAVMACANAANTVTFYVLGPASKGVLSTFATSISVTMMSRVMLHIRQNTHEPDAASTSVSSNINTLTFLRLGTADEGNDDTTIQASDQDTCRGQEEQGEQEEQEEQDQEPQSA